MDISGLRRLWREAFGSEPPEFRTEKLRRAVAFGLQVKTHGDLSPRELRELRLAGRRSSGLARKQAPASGTKLLRVWEGKVHEVLVVNEGYLWDGKVWPSLTRVAFEITGGKWNGPAFFGLRSKAERRDD